MDIARDAIDDEVCSILIDHGRDGHVDGHDLLTEMVLRRVSESVAAERERIGARLLKLHERDGARHGYWLQAWRELFGA